jgi:hypothetical protein
MKIRPSGEQQTTEGAATWGLSRITSATQLLGHEGGFGPAMAAQAQYNNNAAERRILFATSDLKTEFVLTVSPICPSLTIPYFGFFDASERADKTVASPRFWGNIPPCARASG